MSAYPIVVRKITMQHRTFEKDYHQLLIATQDGNCLLINRWGRRGLKGQLEYHKVHGPDAAVKMMDTKRNKKIRDGYVYNSGNTTIDKSVECADEEAFKKAVGKLYWFELGEYLEWLAPGIDMAGVQKAPKSPWAEEDGKIVNKGYQPRNQFVEAQPTVEDQVAQNENWGAW